MTPARPHPPSAQRIAEARARGHVPRAPLIGVLGGVLASAVGSAALGPALIRDMRALVRAPLEAIAAGRGADAYVAAGASLRSLAALGALWLAGATLAIGIAVALGQGPALGSPFRDEAGYPGVRPSRTASALFVLGLLGSGAHALVVSLTGQALVFVDYASVVCALAVGCALIDLAFARARFVASLWLTRGEQRDAERRDFGSPEVRRARSEARRAMQGSAP